MALCARRVVLLLFFARISVTRRSKEKYLIAGLKGSRVKYLVSDAWNINYAYKKKKKPKKTNRQTWQRKYYRSLPTEGIYCCCCCCCGSWARVNRGGSWSGNLRLQFRPFVEYNNIREETAELLIVWSFTADTSGNKSELLDKTNKRNYSIGYQNLLFNRVFFFFVATQCAFRFLRLLIRL